MCNFSSSDSFIWCDNTFAFDNTFVDGLLNAGLEFTFCDKKKATRQLDLQLKSVHAIASIFCQVEWVGQSQSLGFQSYETNSRNLAKIPNFGSSSTLLWSALTHFSGPSSSIGRSKDGDLCDLRPCVLLAMLSHLEEWMRQCHRWLEKDPQQQMLAAAAVQQCL